MRRLTLTALAGAGVLIASGAYAAADEFQVGTGSPLLHQTRLICNEAGRCWHSRTGRVIIERGTNYRPRRYGYDEDYDRGYYRGPGVGVYGPGFSVGPD